MPEKKKKKRDFLSTFQSVERYHRRRSTFVLHIVLSLAFQVLLWANWYGSYAAHGRGFDGTFFTDRLSVSVALALFLVGHFVVMYLSEARDRLVVRALERHDDELDLYSDDDDEDAGVASDDEAPVTAVAAGLRQRRR
jgi:hypothetical protein